MRNGIWPAGAAVLVMVGSLLVGCGTEERTSAANEPDVRQTVPRTGSEDATHAQSGHSMNSPSMQRLHAMTGAEFERGFLTAMIEHHQGAVDMSRMAQPHLKRQEVRVAAVKIIHDQEKEIAQMRSWLNEWSGAGSEPEMAQLAKSEMDAMMTAFGSDCKTDCDRAFLSHMIAHHQGALDMAPMVQARANHPELKQLAGKMLDKRRKEIEQFQSWLAGF